MQRIAKILRQIVGRILAKFDPGAFTLAGIHLTALLQTAVYHPEIWTELHTAITIVLMSKVIAILKE
jgi:hypothetical protein